MNIIDIIAKKRDGKELNTDEIYFFIKQYRRLSSCSISYGNIYKWYEL